MSKKQYAVIGLGTFGYNVAVELSKQDIQVLAIDMKEDIINEISSYVAHAVAANATDEKVLKDLGIIDCDTVIISIGENMETSILVTLLVKDLGIKNIIVKSISPTHSRIVSKIGATRIIYPEYEMARKLAESLASPNILEEIELSEEYNIIEMVAPKIFWEKTIIKSGVRTNFKVSVIAIKRQTPIITENGESDTKEEINIAPGPDDEIQENDILLVVGKESDLKRLKEL